MHDPSRAWATPGQSAIALLPFNVGAAAIEDALTVYGQVWPGDDPAETRGYFTDYAGYDDFIGVVAVLDDTAVGVGFGARSYPGIWWHDEVAQRLGPDHPALQNAWRLVELAVVPSHQRRGVGGRIHDTLLAAQGLPRGLIATTETNHRARGMYERRGWTQVGDPLLLPGKAEAHVVFGREFARTCQGGSGS